MEILYDTFDISSPPETVEPRIYGKRKRTATDFLDIDSKLKKYKIPRRTFQSGGVI